MVITATGSGKTMIGIIPTLLGKDDELAIIVLPLNSLITDYKCKFTAMKIPFDVYPIEKHYFMPYSKFLLISADVTLSSKWPQFLNDLSHLFDISRIISDKSHIPTILTDYRRVMSLLDQLHICQMQIVLLTRTCPPSSEAQIRPELEYIHMKKASSVAKALENVDHIL